MRVFVLKRMKRKKTFGIVQTADGKRDEREKVKDQGQTGRKFMKERIFFLSFGLQELSVAGAGVRRERGVVYFLLRKDSLSPENHKSTQGKWIRPRLSKGASRRDIKYTNFFVVSASVAASQLHCKTDQYC